MVGVVAPAFWRSGNALEAEAPPGLGSGSVDREPHIVDGSTCFMTAYDRKSNRWVHAAGYWIWSWINKVGPLKFGSLKNKGKIVQSHKIQTCSSDGEALRLTALWIKIISMQFLIFKLVRYKISSLLIHLINFSECLYDLHPHLMMVWHLIWASCLRRVLTPTVKPFIL